MHDIVLIDANTILLQYVDVVLVRVEILGKSGSCYLITFNDSLSIFADAVGRKEFAFIVLQTAKLPRDICIVSKWYFSTSKLTSRIENFNKILLLNYLVKDSIRLLGIEDFVAVHDCYEVLCVGEVDDVVGSRGASIQIESCRLILRIPYFISFFLSELGKVMD